MADPAGQLNPEDYNFFRQSKRRVKDSYFLGLEQNDYQKGVLGAGYTRNVADLTRKFSEMRKGLPGGFAKRGMLNSGAYQRSVADFNTQRNTTMQNTEAQNAEQIWGLALARNQLESVKTNAEFDIDEQERARRAAIAAAIDPNMAAN